MWWDNSDPPLARPYQLETLQNSTEYHPQIFPTYLTSRICIKEQNCPHSLQSSTVTERRIYIKDVRFLQKIWKFTDIETKADENVYLTFFSTHEEV